LDSPFSPPPPTASAISISLAHLKSHGLLQPPPPVPKKLNAPTSKPKSEAAAIDFLLPQLQGPTIAHHFQTLAHYTAEPYLSMATSFSTVEFAPMPDPQTWILSPGWTYYSLDGSWKAIDYPEASDDTLVFDVETLPYSGGDYPVMAVAAGRKGWYAWCSPWLTGDSDQPNHLIPFDKDSINSASTSSSITTPAPISTSPLPFPSTSSLLESPNDPPRLLIGHNVLYDRARVGSEYTLRRPATRWLDTQSLHVATAGLTNPQRPAWMLYRKNQGLEAAEKARNLNAAGTIETKVESRQNAISTLPTSTSKSIPPAPFKAKQWQDVSSMNSLVEVARLHCGIEVDKSLRNVFIDPATTISDVRDNFEALVGYCATDVLNTQAVYRAVLPKFLKRCPHPASFSGILVMSQPVLPVDYKWPEYLERAQLEYETRLTGVKNSLHELAEEARKLMGKMGKNGKWEWEEDLWLRQLDWSPRKARRLPKVTGSAKSKKAVKEADSPVAYPTWFAAIKPTNASRFPLQTPLAAILLQTTWRSFPTYFSRSRGWLFAVPSRKKFVPGPKEEQVDPSTLDETDYRIKSLKGLKLWTITSPGRCMTLLSKRNLSLGMLGSKYPEMGMLAELEKNPTPKQLKPIVDKLELLAKEAMEAGNTIDGENNLWLRQLDWSPLVGISQSATVAPTIQPSAVTKVDLVWPQWYLDLDKVGVGLDISIGKRAAPLLLKLQWKGYPVCYSKQHGWTFRVSKESSADFFASDPTLKPCDFDDVADASLKDDTEALFVKLPHEDGEEKNVGSPLSKSFVGAFDVGVLSSEYPAAAAALAMNASCSYWASSKERIVNQMVVWEGDATKSAPTPAAIANSSASTSTQGLILPQVTPMGTITRRAVERTWLTASNAKKNRVGSELKSMIRAPPGYAIVGADVDSEELWICSVMGDAQFGIHGATAIGWMTLEGTKSAGTDLHSKSASILGISRDDAKVFNYSRIYGAGVRHAVQLLLKSNPALTKDEATGLAKNLYASTKGLTSRAAFNRDFWYGGTESFVFNKLEQIAMSDEPQTPALGCGITDALTKAYLPTKGRDTYLPSRINWVVQSSGVDYLHLLLVSMEYLTRRFNIDARYMISVHDEIRYLVKEEDKHRAAMALQISNLWTRALFTYRLQMGDLPQVG
jgi:DNA polymerase gamma 1